MNDHAAHSLEGLVLDTGWKVLTKMSSLPGSTGGAFSVCYKVEKDGETCFLKAFDFYKFFRLAEVEAPGKKQTVDVMGDMLSAYRYERDLSEHCKEKRVTKVSFVREAGEVMLPKYTVSVVPYLIFDLAEGDVRSQVNFSNELDFTWKLGSLHGIAVGLRQLHQIEVSHQDLKPSNILLFNRKSKLGDLGRSLCKNLDSPYKDRVFTGDYTYAPPEIMYDYYESDWHKRVYATDCYLLGSMVVFYFAGVSMSALLMNNLDNQFRAENWRGDFEQIKPYLADSFATSLEEFAMCIDNDFFRNELRAVVEQLCFPFPEKRGHPKAISELGNNYNLERFVSRFDFLFRRAEYMIKSNGEFI